MRNVSIAVLAVLLAIEPTSGADTVTAVFSSENERLALIYLDASCSDNPECQVGSVTCDSSGLGLELIAISDQDAANLLKDASGVRLQSGKQSAVLLPTALVFDELNGGWDITFGAWRSSGEENEELVAQMVTSPLELVEVAKAMDIDLPTAEANMAQQRAFAAACIDLR